MSVENEPSESRKVENQRLVYFLDNLQHKEDRARGKGDRAGVKEEFVSEREILKLPQVLDPVKQAAGELSNKYRDVQVKLVEGNYKLAFGVNEAVGPYPLDIWPEIRINFDFHNSRWQQTHFFVDWALEVGIRVVREDETRTVKGLRVGGNTVSIDMLSQFPETLDKAISEQIGSGKKQSREKGYTYGTKIRFKKPH